MTVSVLWKFNKRFFKCTTSSLLFCVGVGLSGLPARGDDLSSTFQIHGFLSQGYNWTSKNNFYGNSDDAGSFEFTELGVNASWQPLTGLQMAGQMVLRRAGETDDGSPRIDYGLINYTLFSDMTNRWGVRLGRIKNPLGLYNETRDVIFTRPSILLPQSIYFDPIRSLVLSSDGMFFYGERLTDYGDFFFQAGAGYPRAVDREVEPFVFGQRLASGEFESQISYISRLLYEWQGGRIRAGLTYVQADWEYDEDSPFTVVGSGSLRFKPWIFSLQYNAERWSLTAEYSQREIQLKDFVALPDTSLNQEAYYLQGSYRFSERWEGLLRYDAYFFDKKDRSGEQFALTDPLGRPAHSRFAKDWTVGLRWSVTPNFSVWAEYHRVDGTGWLPPLDNKDPGDTERYWDLISIMASYRF